MKNLVVHTFIEREREGTLAHIRPMTTTTLHAIDIIGILSCMCFKNLRKSAKFDGNYRKNDTPKIRGEEKRFSIGT